MEILFQSVLKKAARAGLQMPHASESGVLSESMDRQKVVNRLVNEARSLRFFPTRL